MFNVGDGRDTIQLDDNAGVDTLAFGEGITLADLQLGKNGFNLTITVGHNDDRVLLNNWFYPNGEVYRLDHLTFADGTSMTFDELLAAKPLQEIGTVYNDSLQGYEGADIMTGNIGDDYLSSGAGNDILIGGPGSDTLYGGAGNDTFVFNLGDGEDTICLDDYTGSDTLAFGEGITAADLTIEKNGNDLTIKVGAYGDHIKLPFWFSAGYGGSRLDLLAFADGTTITFDALLAAKPVYEIGTSNNDNLQGYEGVDIMSGGAEADTLYGNDGADILQGGADIDSLNGGRGDDILIGGTGSDNLYGGVGNDTFVFNLGDGKDTIYLDDADGFDTLALGEGISVDDLNLLKTVSNDLTLAIGGNGDQVLLSNWFNSAYAAKRLDQLSFADGTTMTFGDLLAAKPVQEIGTANNDYLQGYEGADIMTGGAGADTLYGYDGADILQGGANIDYLNGGSGDDILIGGTGSDTLCGGAGDDTFVFNLGDGQDTIGTDDNTGTDTLSFGAGISLSDLQLQQVGTYNLLIKVGTGGDQMKLNSWYSPNYEGYRIDKFNFANGSVLTASELLAAMPVHGTDSANSFSGIGSENDWFDGGAGADTLYGNNGNDLLSGGADNDYLSGGNGDDILIGGTGSDTLYGGAGNDTFVFDTALSSPGNIDTLPDFAAGVDKIQLDTKVFTALTQEGTLNSEFLRCSTTGLPVDQNDYFLYKTATGALFYDADGSGQGVAVQFATLTQKPAITATGFIVAAS